MRTDVFVYMAGPITARNGYSIEDNRKMTEKALYELLRAGIPCFMPPIIPHTEVDYETCLQYDNVAISRCTAMVMLPRWNESPGALKERALAIELDMEIFDSVEELIKAYGEPRTVPETTGRKARKRAGIQQTVSTEGSDERLQKSNSEGAHHSEEHREQESS